MRPRYSFALPVRKYGYVHLRPSASVEFSAATFLVSKGGVATITVTKTGVAPAAVNYATVPGSAQAGVDYLPTTGVLSWGSGETGIKSFAVTILDTADQTGSVSLTLTLTGSDLLLGDQRTATLQINRALVQTLIVPDDRALLAPVPNAGLLAPQGGRFALEGADGGVVVVDLAPGARFTGMVPRRVLQTGTSAGLQLFGLSRFGDSTLPDDAGDRVLRVVPSDTEPLPIAAVGGFYLPDGGVVTFTTDVGVEQVLLPPRTAYRSGAVLRISATGTDAEPIYAFVRQIDLGPRTLVLDPNGQQLVLSDFGQMLTVVDEDVAQPSNLSISAFGQTLALSSTGQQIRVIT